MRHLIIPALALATMAASPAAMAQSQQAKAPQGQEQMQSAEGAAEREQASARTYDEVRATLEKAGMQDLKVQSAAYLVQAQSPEGEQVSFVVEPPVAGAAGTEVAGDQAMAAGASGSAASQENVRNALSEAGFENIQILGATYVAQATTQDGDQITMMIDAGDPAADRPAVSQTPGGETTDPQPSD